MKTKRRTGPISSFLGVGMDEILGLLTETKTADKFLRGIVSVS